MRCKNVPFRVKFRNNVTHDESGTLSPYFSDENGVVYSVEAVKRACANAREIPVVRYDKFGERRILGVAKTFQYDPDDFSVVIEGCLEFGGTSDLVVACGTEEQITSMKFTEVGLVL